MPSLGRLRGFGRCCAALLAWLLGLVALPAIGPELPTPDGEVIVILPAGLDELPAQRRAELAAHPSQAPPAVLEAIAASSFSQLPAGALRARGLVVVIVATYVYDGTRVPIRGYVGMSDPVNRWDPSGLFWRLYMNEGSWAWTWVDEPDVQEYDRSHIPTDLVEMGQDMIRRMREQQPEGARKWEGLYVDFKGGFPEPSGKVLVTGGNLFKTGEGWVNFFDSTDRLDRFTWAREIREVYGDVARREALLQRVPEALILGVIAGELADLTSRELIGELTPLGDAARVAGKAQSVGAAQLREDSLRQLGVAPPPGRPMLEWLGTAEGAVTGTAAVQARVFDDFVQGLNDGSAAAGVRAWLGNEVVRQVQEIQNSRVAAANGANFGEVFDGLIRAPVSPELIGLFALSQNNITTPGAQGVNTLVDDVEISETTLPGTFAQGDNALLLWESYVIRALFDTVPNYIPEEARVNK